MVPEIASLYLKLAFHIFIASHHSIYICSDVFSYDSVIGRTVLKRIYRFRSKNHRTGSIQQTKRTDH